MSKSKREKQKFEEILREIRSDIDHIKKLAESFSSKLSKTLTYHRVLPTFSVTCELRSWMYDTFLDKIYETNSKVREFLKSIGFLHQYKELEVFLDDRWISYFASSTFFSGGEIDFIKESIDRYEKRIERVMDLTRKIMYELNWEPMKQISTVDYVAGERKKFLKARDELENVKKAIEDERWDDVMNRLRTAIDLSIKEKFGFQKIHPMKAFLDYADKENFPLPSYTLVYNLFDEGSSRVHEGRIHTPFEAKEALKFISRFIDELDLIEVEQSVVDDFKKKCKAVE